MWHPSNRQDVLVALREVDGQHHQGVEQDDSESDVVTKVTEAIGHGLILGRSALDWLKRRCILVRNKHMGGRGRRETQFTLR